MREVLRGVGDLGRGFRFWITSPRLMLLGAVPALIVGVVWAGLLLLLVVNLDAVATGATAFADGWGELWRRIAEAAAGLAILVVAVFVAVLTFTSVVLAVGDPFYERISGAVERRLGDPPQERDEPWLRGVLRAAREGLAIAVVSAGVGLLVFAVGLIPIAGTAVGLVLGALLGGRLLVLELTATPLDARGLDLRARRRLVAQHRGRALGFGAATWLLLLIPFAAVIVMPAAVSGATVLSRTLTEPRTDSAETGTGGRGARGSP